MPDSEVRELSAFLRQVKDRSGVEIAVYIPRTLQDRTIEDFSLAVAETWKLGRKKEDKALLFVVAPKEKKMRIEVGYGMEGDITDALSRRVLDNIARPRFREGNYTAGIVESLLALQEKIPMGLEPPPKKRRSGGSKGFVNSIIIFIVILAFILDFVSRLLGFRLFHSGRRGGWGGGGFGGGGFGGGGFGGGGGSSWGGGGGGFGGGGASSSW